MFKPDPRSAKLLTTYASDTEVQPRSFRAVKALHDKAPGQVNIRWNRRTGGIRSVRGILTETGEGSAQEIAEKFLTDNRELFGISEQPADLQFIDTHAHRGIQHLKYQQHYHSLPIIGAEVIVHIDQANRIQMVNGSYYPEVEADTATPPITETEAAAAAIAVLETEEHSEPQAELVIFPLRDQHIHAYRVVFQAKDPLGDWVVFVDASTGDVIDYYNAIHFVIGRGQVYNSNPKRDKTIITADLSDLDESKTLSGQYFAVKNAAKNGTNAVPSGPDAYDFLFGDPAETHFDEVMVYYHLNKINRFFRNLGYEAHDYQMLAHVHVPDPADGNADYDNAYFSPFDKAFFWGHGDVLNDLAQEAAVIYHEYTHSVVDAIQPLMATPEAGALHEGYADYFACSLTDDPKIGEFAVEAAGEEFLRDLHIQKTYETITKTDVHADGEIWGAACWKIRETLGRRVADLLLYDSLQYLPPNAHFVDAAEGILQADTNLFNGKYTNQLKSLLEAQKILVEPTAKYSIAARAGTGGSLTPSGVITVRHGGEQTFTITPESEYYVKHVLIDGNSKGARSSYCFENVQASHSIEAFFENNAISSYIIAASSGPGGTMTPSGEIAVSQGTNQVFTAAPESGYALRHILVDGVSVETGNEYTFENVSAAHTIEALFEALGQVERVICVPGNARWIDSGICLAVGDIISFAACGTIVYDNKGHNCGPAGTFWTDTLDKEDPLWKKPHAGLIGKIEGIGAPFFIGESYTVKAGSRGKLLLGINDFWNQGNCGEFTITVRLLNKTS